MFVAAPHVSFAIITGYGIPLGWCRLSVRVRLQSGKEWYPALHGQVVPEGEAMRIGMRHGFIMCRA